MMRKCVYVSADGTLAERWEELGPARPFFEHVAPRAKELSKAAPLPPSLGRKRCVGSNHTTTISEGPRAPRSL